MAGLLQTATGPTINKKLHVWTGRSCLCFTRTSYAGT